MVHKILMPLISIVVTFILIVFNIFTVKNIDTKNDIDSVSREYLLKMESDGYLSDENKTLLRSDLANLGVHVNDSSFSLAGTTVSDAGYGNPVVLKVRGNVDIYDFSVSSLFQITKKDDATSTFNIEKKSIAKD